MANECTTLTKLEDGTYSLLIQGERHQVVFYKRGIPFRKAVAEIENRMYTS